MKKRIFILVAFLIIIFCPVVGSAEESEESEEESIVSFGAEFDTNSRYLWRGAAFSEGFVMQPSLWVSAFDLTFTAWGSMPLDKEQRQGEFNEVDFILGYNYEIWKFSFNASFIYYLIPYTIDTSTGEINLKAAFNIYNDLSAFTFHAVDLIDNAGAYWGNAGLSYEYSFVPQFVLNSSIYFGWANDSFNNIYLGLEKNAFDMFDGSISLTYSIDNDFGTLYFRGHFELSILLDSELRDQLGDDSNLFSVGLAIGANL